MMINQLITYLLEKIIGKYVENFSTQNVKTGLFKGDIRLENLPLKQSVLEDFFEWPILVKSGLIGKVTLRIPYTRFRSQAWAIMIEDIYIVAGPNSTREFFEKEFQNENIMKNLILDSLEAKWRKKIRQQGDADKAEANIWLSYVASLGYRILRNIQIEVRNVHVRYEDNSTIPSQFFSTGLIINEFSTKSSDFEWDSKSELKMELDVVNKQVELSGISFYIEANCKSINEICTENIKSILQEKVKELQESDYLVKPISLHGIMKRNINPLPVNHEPRIYLHLQMNLVEVNLSQAHYKTAVALSDEIERFDRQKQHVKYRPRHPIMESAREWWVFAITEHIRHVRKGAALRERARHLVEYVQSYENYLLNKDNSKDSDFRKNLESDLELDSLIHLREVAMERVHRKSRDLMQNVDNSQITQQSGWWGYLWGRRSIDIPTEILSPSSTNSETSQILEKLLPEESKNAEHGIEQDISEILNEADYEAVNFFTRDKIFLRGEFSLDGIKLKLLKDVENPILEINADNLIVGFESRPQYSSWFTRIGLRSLFVHDLNQNNINTFRDVVSSMGHSRNDGGEIFALTYESNPLPNACAPNIKRILTITSEPLTIVHCPLLIESVKEFFSRSTDNIKAAAEKHIKNAKARTRESIRKILDKGSTEIRWWVSLKISAPKIVLPNYRLIQIHDPSCVLLDLGKLQVSNCNDQQIYPLMKLSNSRHLNYESDLESDDFITPASSPLGSLDNISIEIDPQEIKETKTVSNIYDEYSIKLENVMALVGTWNELQSFLSKDTAKSQKLLLMEPFNLSLDLKRKAMVDQTYQLPNLILESTLSKLLISISDHKLELAKGCLESLTSYNNNSENSDKSPLKHKRLLRVEDVNRSAKNQNYKSVSINFVLKSFIIQLESQNRPLAELSLTEAHFQLSRYTSETIIEVQLLNLILADARANLGRKLDFILASHKCVNVDKPVLENAEDPIIEFIFKITSDSKSSSLKYSTNLTFSDLDVIANQETLTELLSFMNLLFSNNTSQYIDNKHDSSNLIEYEVLDISVVCKAVNILLIKISSNSDSENRFAESVGKISLSYMNLHMSKNGSFLTSTVQIRSINVEDISTPDSLHKNIVTLTTGSKKGGMNISEAEDVINLSLIQESSDKPFFVSGTLPHIIYVHSPQFLNSVEACISEFQIYLARLKDNIAAVARTAILSSENNEKIGFLNTVRLNLKMLSPILVLPRFKSSNEIILVNLGDIELSSNTESIQVVFTDAIVIPKELPIYNGSYDINICTDNSSKFPLVNKTDLLLKISKVFDPSRILIECEFSSSLSLSFSKAVYEQVLKSMDNLVYDDEDSKPYMEFEDELIKENQNVDITQSEIPIVLRSNISQIKMELYPDSFENDNDPMLRLLLQGISLEFVRKNKYVKDIELVVDQISLYQVLDSRQNRIQKLLIYSISTANIGNENFQEKSASCPDLMEELHLSRSHLQSSPLYKYPKRKKSLSNNIDFHNCNQVESKTLRNNVKAAEPDKLAKIKIKLIDKKIPKFAIEFDSINRFVDADFNQLTFRISMEAWVILLDFFGLGSRFYDPKDIKDLSDVSKVLPSFNRRYDGEIEEIINTKLNIHMKRFSLILENETCLNHSNLAEISTINFDLEVITKDGNLTSSGSLSNFQLDDLSPTGAIYNERLFPASNQDRIFEFQLFKYGLPDPSLLRDEDMRLSVKISAPIVYVHTQRFLQELNQFFQNFLQYQDRLSHMRVTSAGRTVDKSAQRSARIRMKFSCQAPLLLLPVSAFSDHILVIDLGKLSLINEFKFPNNNTSLCLLDEMKINLHDMDVYSGIRISDSLTQKDTDLIFPCLKVRPIYPKPLSQKCNLNLSVSRNLNSNISHSSPDWQIFGNLSSAVFSININQYKTIRGVLSHNLGENVDHLKSYKFQAFQTDPILHTDLTGIAYLTMKIELCLNDVQLNLMSQIQGINNDNFNLCQLNFLKSKLLYESYSDSSKTIALICQQITVEDMRHTSYPANNRSNVFPTIISPDRDCTIIEDEISSCQLHIKYASNNDQNDFIVYLNKIKAVMIFDWIRVTKNWIFTSPYEIVSLSNDDENRFDQHVAYYIQSKPQSRPISFQTVIMREYYQEIIQEEFKPTQLTFNVQESRFFILEDSSQIHSHALILIVAGTCSYQTRENRPGPFSFSVSQFHLASCVMSSDTSNLLSIINPVEMKITSEEKLFVTHGNPSLYDVLHEKDSTKLGIDIAVSKFKIRLSFSDIQLLAKIMQSFQNQTIPPDNTAYQVEQLRHHRSSLNNGNLYSSKSIPPSITPLERLSKFIDRIYIHHLDKRDFVSICLIDDCIDADVPLFDIIFNSVSVDIELGLSKGTVTASLSVDYYNTKSFGWTPVVETWPIKLCYIWECSKELSLKSEETLNIDISSHLLQMTKNTFQKWSTEFQQKSTLPCDSRKQNRTLFVPFLIVNELGCPIKYRKLNLDNPPMYDIVWKSNTSSNSNSWIIVPDSIPAPLFFDMETTARDKIRYDELGEHFNTNHRIELALDGWNDCQPITVDKLGVFYRHLRSDTDGGLDLVSTYIRIVIEIIRQGSVQNKIIIRSPLQLYNSLNIPIEVKFSEKSNLSFGGCSILKPNTTIPIPLLYSMHDIQIRPLSPTYNKPVSPSSIDCLLYSPMEFSENIFSWCTVKTPGQKIETEFFCHSSKSIFNSDQTKNKIYLICTIECLNFPLTPKMLPGHLITISAPFSLENRLPCDVRFAMKSEPNDNGSIIKNEALVRPSCQCTVLTTSMKQSAYFSVYLDSFPRCDPLLIHGDVKLSHSVLIRLYDEQNRLLELEVKVESRPSGPVSVIISALYWIVNRTSLPLVYAQSGETDTLAAGHVPENEEACSSMSFPFNFSNKNDSFTFRVRLGSKTQLSNIDSFKPLWSDKISLEKVGTTTLQLRAAFLDQHRPHLLYNIGLEIRPGRGKHSNTKMIILTARYLLDNKSSYPLYFAQYNCTDQQNNPIMALPGSFLTFHWPRDDLDQLLTVQKLNFNHQIISKVSGGFQIDQCTSFHVYLRGTNSNPSSQLRVSISLREARYRVVFTDVEDLPSPYKLENLTSLQVFFYQNVAELNSRKYSVLPPNSSILYALDEPTLPPVINLSIDGGTQSCYDINKVGRGQNLFYDNFLYVVIRNSVESDNDSCLVFDVPQNTKKIFLNQKNSNNTRSQLWYYSSNNELFHEGSIAPHDPKQKLDRSAENHLLLDVDMLAPCPSSVQKKMYRMILAKADPRREKYQRWYFSDTGCLTNKLGMRCYIKANCKNAAVFGGFECLESYYSPFVYKDWFRPGSGEVLVSVITDGPTRVLRLIDKNDEFCITQPLEDTNNADSLKYLYFEIKLNIKGFGVFLINHIPEELFYAVCNNIEIVCRRKSRRDYLHVRIGQIQVDNQQIDASYPCMMYEENIPKIDSHNAFSLEFEREIGHPYDVHVFNYIRMQISPMCVILEEKMLLKTMQIFWSPSKETELSEEDFNSLQNHSYFHEGRKIYIGKLKLLTGNISLSVITAESLPFELKQIKKLFPSLMSFTNAQIIIGAYDRNHVFETSNLIFRSILRHYENQLRSQAIKIFGSVDFLGNPIGFISDITTGMKRLYSDQNVYHMVKHFAHGIGDSTAKICSSASRVISEITMDPEYEENRQRLFESARISGSNTAQVKAGFKSLAYGFLGAFKSVPTQIDKGYKNEGPSGLVIGALKGIVGVVTKPVGGMLDLATGSATSFREIARSSKEGQPPRRYEPRCLSSSWKLLPFYTTYSNNLCRSPLKDLTQAQHLLARFSTSSSIETVVGFLIIQNSKESQLKVIVSDTSIHIIKTVRGESDLLKHYPLSKLSTPPISVNFKSIIRSHYGENSVYINFNYLRDSSEFQVTPKPPFKCDTMCLAKQLVKLVCEAHCDYLERQMTYNVS